ncbi:MAG: BNR-4 repeat-containing protein [Elusimicrobiota bacterium]
MTTDNDKSYTRADGYYGIWYYNQASKDEYKFKYSGGLATYPQQMNPFAVYSKEVDKTFFCYGGTTVRNNKDQKPSLLHMVGYYDHKTGMFPKPVVLLDKKTDDAHDNPIISIDGAGYIWIFSNAHGTGRPSFIHKSVKPYDISNWALISTTNFSYGNIFNIPEVGFVFPHTNYEKGERALYFMKSKDGITWTPNKKVAKFEKGHYQVVWHNGKRIGTAFNMHPLPIGLNARTNVYYMQTDDYGDTWTTASGEKLELPLSAVQNPALVHDYQKDGVLVYTKNVQFDTEGNPVLFYLTSKGFESGPENNPRILHTARWTGKNWEIRDVTTTGNNYDYGPLYIEPDGTWRVIGPFITGPQPYNPGGEIVMLTSTDQGKTWVKVKQLTTGSERNQTYVRMPLNAHPGFYAFWADGNAREASVSALYFTNKTGDHVWRLPMEMKGEFAKPEIVK